MTDTLSAVGRSDPGRRLIVMALVTAASLWMLFEWRISQSPDGRDAYERTWIEWLRDPQDTSRMIGPPLLEESVRDFSALGGYAVITTLIVTVTLLGGLRYGRPWVRFFLITVLGGFACSMLLKLAFGRERPAVVRHLSHVATTSFPSGHAMMSSIVYLCIGLLLARRVQDARIRTVLVLVPLFLTVLVGISRVAMGVHYPTDVLAGWTAGLTWTVVAFTLHGRFATSPSTGSPGN